MGVRAGCWLLAVTALLGACSGEEPAGTLPPMASQSPLTAAPGKTTPPQLAAAALPATAQGASAFATYYMELIEYTFATGDATALRTASDAACLGCRNFLEAAAKASSAGEFAIDADIEVLEAVSPAIQAGETTVDLRYKRTNGTVVDGAGNVIKSIRAQNATDVQITVSRGRSWIVTAFTAVSAAS